MALIFDVERFSTKDGPGVRTVVFFKGCNMRCVWCHNPEGVHEKPELLWQPDSCIGCGHCAKVCPVHAHTAENGQHRFDPALCRECLACTSVCYAGALRRAGTEMSTEALMREIEADRVLYEKSGGGVTLTGGEVMLQPQAAEALLQSCKAAGIGTAIETNLSVPWESYERILPLVDFLFLDIKHTDSAKHCAWTGIPNERIIENFKRLKTSGCTFAVRTPIVPGFNDDAETVTRIAQMCADASTLQYYELLTYNPLGGSKGALVHPPQSKIFLVPAREKMKQLAAAAAAYAPCVRLDGKKVGRGNA